MKNFSFFPQPQFTQALAPSGLDQGGTSSIDLSIEAHTHVSLSKIALKTGAL